MIRGFFIAVVFTALMAALGMLLVTQWAFDKIWLPQAAKAAKLEVATDSTRWFPKSGFIINGLQFRGENGLAGSIERLEVDYDLTALKRGVLLLSGVRVINSKIELGINTPKPEEAPEDESKKKPGTRLRRSAFTGIPMETGTISLRNCSIAALIHKAGHDPARTRLLISTLNIDSYSPGFKSTVNFDARVAADFGAGTNIKDCKVTAVFALEPDADFNFRNGQGRLTVVECDGTVGSIGLNGYRFGFVFDLDPYKLKDCSLVAEYEGAMAGRFSVSGPVDFNLNTAELIARIDQVSPSILNLWTAPHGFCVQSGTVSAASQIIVGKETSRFQGEAKVKGVILRKLDGQNPLPELDASLAFGCELANEQSALTLEKAIFKASQGKTPLAEATLNNPLRISWDPAVPPAPGSAELVAQIFPTDITAFREAWAGSENFALSKGRVSGSGKVAASAGGRKVEWKFQAQLDSLNGRFQGLSLANGQAQIATQGGLSDFESLSLPSLTLAITDGGAPKTSLQISGKKDAATGQFKLAGSGEAGWLFSFLPCDREIEKGVFKAEASATWTTPAEKNYAFQVESRQMTGIVAGLAFVQGSAKASGEAKVTAREVTVKPLKLSIQALPDAQAGEIVADLAWADADKHFRASAELSNWSGPNLSAFLGRLVPGIKTTVKSLSGQASVERSKTRHNYKLALAADELSLVAVDPAAPKGAPADVSLDFQAGGEPGRIEIGKGDISWHSQGSAPSSARIGGWFATGRVCQITFDSQVLDFSPWAALASLRPPPAPPAPPKPDAPQPEKEQAKKESKKESKKEKKEGKKKAAPEPPPEPAPTPLAPVPQIVRPEAPKADRVIRVRVEKMRIPEMPDFGIEAQWSDQQEAGTFELIRFQSGPGTATGRLHFAGEDQPGQVTLSFQSDQLPIDIFKNLVPKENADLCHGRLTSKISLLGNKAGGVPLQDTVEGVAELRLADASLETIPASKSFLKAAAATLCPEFAATKFTEASGTVTATRGTFVTNNLQINGDEIRLLISGGLKPGGIVDAAVKFTGRTETLEKAQVKIGGAVVSGGTFAQFGTTENGYTTLPGSLPLKGELPDNIQADWAGWLSSMGFGAIQSQVQDLFQDLFKKDKKKK